MLGLQAQGQSQTEPPAPSRLPFVFGVAPRTPADLLPSWAPAEGPQDEPAEMLAFPVGLSEPCPDRSHWAGEMAPECSVASSPPAALALGAQWSPATGLTSPVTEGP